MKKIVLFSLIGCLGFVGGSFSAQDTGTYKCQVQSISAVSWKLSNEFLFPTNADFKDSNGRALVCGHRDIYGCSNGTTVVVAGNHWWKEQHSDDMKVYRCSTGGSNAWADVGYTALKECNTSQKGNWKKIGEINGQKILCDGSFVNTFYRGGYCTNACFTSDCPDCNKQETKPTESKPIAQKPTETKPSKPVKPTTDACAKYKSNPEAYACCKTTGATWNEKEKKCDCDGDFDWQYDDKAKTGKCVAKAKPEVVSNDCTPSDCKIVLNQSIKCKNDNYFKITRNYQICKEDLERLNLITCDDFEANVKNCDSLECIGDLVTQTREIKKAIKELCEEEDNIVYAPVPVVDNSAKIEAAKRTVSSFFSSAESNKSVWKDTEGNFNTARLASDLTAGVVLGTVGGVVSGVVIKKKQIEKGFDALHCSVGGQTVADWGDIFNVGLRR